MAKPPAQSFRDLDVWQKSHHAVLEAYKLTRRLPKEELFGLVSQMPILCADLSYLPPNALGDALDEVARMLDSYTQKILDSRF